MSKEILVTDLLNSPGGYDTKADAQRAVDRVFASVERIARGGSTVSIKGFGSFEPKDRAARTGRNPTTGETIQIAAKRVLHFKSKVAL